MTYQERAIVVVQEASLAALRVLVFVGILLLCAGWIVGDYVQVRTNANFAAATIRQAQLAQAQQVPRTP